MKRLIVNSDDYGRTRGVSAGIREAHLHGIVTSTTAMMNFPGVQADLARARDDCPQLGLGVHLVLTAGRPLRPAENVPTLVYQSGEFLHANDLSARFAQIDTHELRDEWGTQIEAYLATGHTLDHLDSHHHASYLHEKVFEVMLQLAQEYGIPIRHPFGPSAWDSPFVQALDPTMVMNIREFVPRLLQQYPVPHPDDMLTSFFGSSATLEHLMILLDGLPEGTHELMCHSGYADDELSSGSSYAVEREWELSVLTDASLSDVIKTRELRLISFAQM